MYYNKYNTSIIRDGARGKKLKTGTWPAKLEEMCYLLIAVDNKVVVDHKTSLYAIKPAIFIANSSVFVLSSE